LSTLGHCSSSLALVRFLILEGESTCPLIRPRLPAYASIGASEEYTPQGNSTQEAAAHCAERKARNPRLSPHSITIKGTGGMEESRYRKRRKRIRRFGICRRRRCSYDFRVS
jgi:hypothetical protein